MKRKEIQKKILIISGEASGDANAAQLINALKQKRANIRFFASGGENCRKAGAEIIYDIKNLGIVGFKAAIQKLPQILKLRSAIKNCIEDEKPDLVIPVDFPDFNISMLKKYHNKGIHILYFISPQIWIWRKNRIYKLKKYIKRILVLLPFEVDLYKSKGIDAVFIGNPAVDRVKTTMKPEEFRKKNNIPLNKPIITFLPGSRFHEIEDFLPVMIESIKLLKKNGDYQFIITPADSVNSKRCEEIIKNQGLGNEILLLPTEAYNAASSSVLVITKSGTSTIEMALIGVPFIVVYKTTFFAYRFIRLFYKKKEVSLANIIGDGNIIPELIQSDFTPEKIFETATSILSDFKKRSEILRYMKKIREKLGQPGAAERAADSVMEMLE
jgi:lipid-A-disaccharide synthase